MIKKMKNAMQMIGCLVMGIAYFLFWCGIGLGHGIVSIINGTD